MHMYANVKYIHRKREIERERERARERELESTRGCTTRLRTANQKL